MSLAGYYPESDLAPATQVAVHPLVLAHLKADPDLPALVGGPLAPRIYAGQFPPGTELPAVKFRFTQSSSLSQPAPLWWTHTGQVDGFTDDEVGADALADAIVRALLRLVDTSHLEGFVGSVSPWDVTSTEDTEWTPPKPRRIVSVTLTARRN